MTQPAQVKISDIFPVGDQDPLRIFISGDTTAQFHVHATHDSAGRTMVEFIPMKAHADRYVSAYSDETAIDAWDEVLDNQEPLRFTDPVAIEAITSLLGRLF